MTDLIMMFLLYFTIGYIMASMVSVPVGNALAPPTSAGEFVLLLFCWPLIWLGFFGYFCFVLSALLIEIIAGVGRRLR